MSIVRDDLSIDQKSVVKLPSRVIINNKVISIYQSDTADSLFKSYYLKDLKIIKPYRKDPKKCIEIGTRKETTVLCSMLDSVSKKHVKFVPNWIEELNDFKNNCKDNGSI